MKKIYILSLALFMAATVSAQVMVTYKVDVTNYIVDNELNANGMRIGGNFATVGGTLADETEVPDWSPSGDACAMTDEGDNVWAITIMYGEAAIGTEQLFKFVNGDWGTNEGGETSGIATGECGVDDGSGNINRTLTIPSNNISLTYCYDSCKTCAGDDALVGIRRIKEFENLSVFPNPTSNTASFKYTLNEENRVDIKIFNLLGAQVATVFGGNLSAGTYNVETSLDNLQSGVYMYQVQVGESITSGQLIKE